MFKRRILLPLPEYEPSPVYMEHNTCIQTVIKACYEVHAELGVGFVEKVFENALSIALRDLGLDPQQQYPVQVYFRDQLVGDFLADIFLPNPFLIELKAVKTLLPEHQAQLINYLNASRIDNGLLVNFGKKGLEIKKAFRTPR